MTKTILTINGIRYDASTGQQIDDSPRSQTVAAAPPAHTESKPTHTTVTKSRTTHIKHHHRPTQKSQTLMRKAVKKPASKTQRIDGFAPINQPSQPTLDPKLAERIKHAQSIPTHNAVRRFDISPAQPSVAPRHAPMAVQPAPMPKPAQHVVHTPTTVTSATQHTSAKEKFVSSQLAKQVEQQHDSPFKKKSLRQKLKSKSRKKRVLSIAASSLAVLLIAGFLVMQNMSTISLVVANRRAGISARMPKGVPSNFSSDQKVVSAKGQVTLTYVSNSDDRAFSLTQQITDMTPASLLEAMEKRNPDTISTFETGGITLYIYGPGEAEWIDQGIRYSIAGNSGLNTEQLAAIATSL